MNRRNFLNLSVKWFLASMAQVWVPSISNIVSSTSSFVEKAAGWLSGVDFFADFQNRFWVSIDYIYPFLHFFTGRNKDCREHNLSLMESAVRHGWFPSLARLCDMTSFAKNAWFETFWLGAESLSPEHYQDMELDFKSWQWLSPEAKEMHSRDGIQKQGWVLWNILESKLSARGLTQKVRLSSYQREALYDFRIRNDIDTPITDSQGSPFGRLCWNIHQNVVSILWSVDEVKYYTEQGKITIRSENLN